MKVKGDEIRLLNWYETGLIIFQSQGADYGMGWWEIPDYD
jgi:hypothetical protein